MVNLMLMDAEIRELLRKNTKHIDMKIQQQLSVTRNKFYLTSCWPLRDAETQVSNERRRKDKTRSTEQCERMTFTKRTSIERKNRRTIKTLSYLAACPWVCVRVCLQSQSWMVKDSMRPRISAEFSKTWTCKHTPWREMSPYNHFSAWWTICYKVLCLLAVANELKYVFSSN